MEKRNRMCIIALVVLVILVVVCSIVLQIAVHHFAESGVHVLGSFAHIEVKQNCYFFPEDKQQIEGESVLRISGYVYDPPGEKLGSFSGLLHVEDYPISVDTLYRATTGRISTSSIRMNTHSAEMLQADTNVLYDVSITRTEEPIIYFTIEREDEDTLYGICADTEGEAFANLERLQDFLKNK